MSLEKIREKTLSVKVTHRHVLATGFGVLGISYLLVLLVDILNIFGLRGLPGGIVPFYWNTLFAERAPIELIQWTLLTGLIIASYRLYKESSNRKDRANTKFWALLAVTAALMLIEDALNPRHTLFRDILDLPWQQINIAETIYFGSLAAIPGYAFLRYGEKIRNHRRTLILLVLGGLFYGLAVTISGPGHSFGVSYLGDVGLNATVAIGGEELQEAYNAAEQRIIDVHGTDWDDLAFMFTDHFIEESLELIGATFLLASAISYMNFRRTK